MQKIAFITQASLFDKNEHNKKFKAPAKLAGTPHRFAASRPLIPALNAMQRSYIETIVLQALQEKDSVMIYSHIEGVKVESIFSECNDYRYELSIEKTDSQGTETVCVIMQNPSVANDQIADKSVQFLEMLIFQKEYPQFSKVKKMVIVVRPDFSRHFSGSQNTVVHIH